MQRKDGYLSISLAMRSSVRSPIRTTVYKILTVRREELAQCTVNKKAVQVHQTPREAKTVYAIGCETLVLSRPVKVSKANRK